VQAKSIHTSTAPWLSPWPVCLVMGAIIKDAGGVVMRSCVLSSCIVLELDGAMTRSAEAMATKHRTIDTREAMTPATVDVTL